MYTMILMMAVSSSPDVSGFGWRNNNCNGCHGTTYVVPASCYGNSCHGYSCHGSSCYGNSCHGYSCHGNSCHGGRGFLGMFHRHGCHGSSCHGYVAPSCGCTGVAMPAPSCGCCGTAVVPMMPAPAAVSMPPAKEEKKEEKKVSEDK